MVLSSGREASSSGSFGEGTQLASWWTHEQPLQHHLDEGEVGLSGQKPVRLDQQPWVDALALGLLAPNLWFLLWQMSTPMMAPSVPPGPESLWLFLTTMIHQLKILCLNVSGKFISMNMFLITMAKV